MNLKLAASILKYNPRETYLEKYYPASDQNRVNVMQPNIDETFDYTSEQLKTAEKYVLDYVKVMSKPDFNPHSYAEDLIRGLIEWQVGGVQFRKELQQRFFDLVGI
jgi:hypothetical protein